jgi:hypothetical protein
MTVLDSSDLGANTTLELVATPENIPKPFCVRLIDDDSGEEVDVFTKRFEAELQARAYFDSGVSSYRTWLAIETMTEAVKKVCKEYGWPLIEVKSGFEGGAHLGANDQNQQRLVYAYLERSYPFAEIEA